MLETKQQKQYFIVALVLVVVLAGVTFWNRPSFRYEEIKVANKSNPAFDQQAYLKYVASLQIDPAASKQLFEQIITQEDIKKEVEAELQVDQAVVPPQVPDQDIKLANKTGSQAVTDYLSASTGIALNFNSKVKDLSTELFNGDPLVVEKTNMQLQKSYQELANTEVPREAATLHKSLLSSMMAYGKLIEVAKNYVPDSEPAGTWPQVYHEYAAINDQVKSYTDELDKLDTKYKLSETPIRPYYVEKDSEGNKSFVFINTAHAFLGIGDVTITIGDIPRIIMDAIKEGLVASFSKFTSSFLQKMLTKIETSYMVANFLYYSDALVSGQYTNDYLNKYVADSLDRQIIKKFIPQFNCGKKDPNLQAVFQAKSTQYLGFNPDDISPSDPDYFQKMAKVGNFLSSPQGWNLHFDDLANQAKSEAEKSAEKELTSAGLKTPRDAIKLSISNSINSIVSAQRAGMQALFNLGSSNAQSFIGKFVAQLTETLLNNYVFRGAVANNGTIGVLKEQSTCLATAQLQVVLPAPGSTYENPPPAPTQDDLLLREEANACVSASDYSANCLGSVNSFYSTKCSGGGAENADLCSAISAYLSNAPLRNPYP